MFQETALFCYSEVYSGLPITSAMVTEEEAEGIRHHFIDFLQPDQGFTGFQFALDAIPIVNMVFFFFPPQRYGTMLAVPKMNEDQITKWLVFVHGPGVNLG